MTAKQKQLIKDACMYTRGVSEERYNAEFVELSEAFLRPPYQYTSLENDTITRAHEDYDEKKIMNDLHKRGLV